MSTEWWEMLDWEQMKETWDRLSEDIKKKIRDAGLAPSYDYSNVSAKND